MKSEVNCIFMKCKTVYEIQVNYTCQVLPTSSTKLTLSKDEEGFYLSSIDSRVFFFDNIGNRVCYTLFEIYTKNDVPPSEIGNHVDKQA